jgi:hypothetical protein
MRVAISGQVDRLLNLADDGKSTKAYFVDNNVSASRLRVVATGQVTDDYSRSAPTWNWRFRRTTPRT